MANIIKEGDNFYYGNILLKAKKDTKNNCEKCYFSENNIICIKKDIPCCVGGETPLVFIECKN